MAKKLSNKQERQIITNHQKRLDLFSGDESSLLQGIVICRYGNQADIEDNNRIIHRCSIRRTIGSLTTGDKVLWHQDENVENEIGIIELVKPRTSELLRPDFYDGLKPVVANVDLVVIVSSLLPELSTNIIDRYLVSCYNAKLPAIIVINKIDLISDKELDQLKERLTFYPKLDYQIFYISTVLNKGISELRDFLKNKTSVLVGQSGVGKSSTLNAILENNEAQTNIVSEISGLGQHTTTSTKLYHIGTSGLIIDSPGVREFGLWHLSPQEITNGYREFGKYLGTCKFKDCQHIDEIGCSIKEAVNDGHICLERYSNYVKIRSTLNLLEKKNKTRKANTNRKKNYK